MDNQVDEKTKKERVKKVLELSRTLEEKYMNEFLNKDVEVLIEKYEDGIITGHTGNYIQVKLKGDISDINKIVKIHIERLEYPFIIGSKLTK